MNAMMAPPKRAFRQGAPSLDSHRPAHAGGGDMDPRLLAILHHLVVRGHIPSFAYGGVAYHPQLAVIGDNPNGPEAVVPLGGGGGNQTNPFEGGGGSFLDKLPGGLGGQLRTQLGANWNTNNGGSKGRINDLLSGGAGGNPAFGPGYLRDSTRRSVLQNAGSQQRNADILSKLYGLDPMQRRASLASAGRDASAGVAGALNAADLEGMSGYQQFIQHLLSGERGFQQNDISDQRAAQREKDSRGSFLGGLAGNVGGKLVNKYL